MAEYNITMASRKVGKGVDNPKDDGNFEVQSWHERGKHWVMLDSSQGWYGSKEWKNDSLPRAIIEACVKALNGEQEVSDE